MKPSELDNERWHLIDEVLDAALDQSPEDRPGFLDRICANDADLKREVVALLEVREEADHHFERLHEMAESFVLGDEQKMVGRRIGPFQVEREIGRGGMGVVYLAEDTRLGRKVALKVLSHPLSGDGDSMTRLQTEARAVSALDHPNIATLYDIGVTDSRQFYMVFAYYEGRTLDQRIEEGPLQSKEAVEIGIQLVKALGTAHRSGVIHRDVKPSNILLTPSGKVKLLDFGVASLEGETLGRGNVRAGTPAYMSPEQAVGGSVDHRSDLWSLGVVLHEMVTGRIPSESGNPDDAREPADAHRSSTSDVPRELRPVISALLSRDPQDRYPSATALLTDLSAVNEREFPSTRPQPSRRVPRQKRLAPGKRRGLTAGFVTLGLIVAGIWIVPGILSAPGTKIERVAVLPFESDTPDPAQQHISNGIHEALIAELGKIGSISVVSRTSVMRHRGDSRNPTEIAKELGVDAILTGSLVHQGDTVTVSSQLFSISTEREVWSETYRRGPGGAFDLPRAVVRSIAAGVEVALTADERRRLSDSRSVDPDAYDAYLRGRFQLDQRTRQSFDLARKYFYRAIDLDSSFAPPYAMLAEALGSAAFFGLTRPRDVMPRVVSLVNLALERDSMLVDAQTTRAAVELYWNWDRVAARRHAERAIDLNASFPRAYRVLSDVLILEGRYDEAISAVERASYLEGLVPFSVFRPVATLYYTGRYEQAIEKAREGLEFYSDFWQGYYLYCLSLAGMARYEEAVAECSTATDQSDRTPLTLGALGYVYAMSGHPGDAERILTELQSAGNHRYVAPSSVAAVLGALRREDQAFESMNRAVQERDPALVHAAEHILFDPLRGDARFDELLQTVGLSHRTPVDKG